MPHSRDSWFSEAPTRKRRRGWGMIDPINNLPHPTVGSHAKFGSCMIHGVNTDSRQTEQMHIHTVTDFALYISGEEVILNFCCQSHGVCPMARSEVTFGPKCILWVPVQQMYSYIIWFTYILSQNSCEPNGWLLHKTRVITHSKWHGLCSLKGDSIYEEPLPIKYNIPKLYFYLAAVPEAAHCKNGTFKGDSENCAFWRLEMTN